MGMDNGVSKLEKQEQTFLFFFSFFSKEFPRLFDCSLPWLSARKAWSRVPKTERKGGGFFFVGLLKTFCSLDVGKTKTFSTARYDKRGYHWETCLWFGLLSFVWEGYSSFLS